jgi:hypothetical protein
MEDTCAECFVVTNGPRNKLECARCHMPFCSKKCLVEGTFHKKMCEETIEYNAKFYAVIAEEKKAVDIAKAAVMNGNAFVANALFVALNRLYKATMNAFEIINRPDFVNVPGNHDGKCGESKVVDSIHKGATKMS